MQALRNNWFLFLFTAFFFTAGCSPEEEDITLANKRSLGTSARDLLSDEKFSSMEIEVAYMTGFEPTATALNNLNHFLQERVNKPGGIQIKKFEIEPSGKASYSIQEVREIEDKNRSAYNSGDEIAVFILFADGKSTSEEDNKMILGTAHRNTSMVIYGKTVRDFANKSSNIPRSEIESTTLKHEFGHLFGLVDNGSPAQSDHEDTEEGNSAHCSTDGCLMMALVEFGGGTIELLKSHNSGEINLDAACIADLRANGGK